MPRARCSEFFAARVFEAHGPPGRNREVRGYVLDQHFLLAAEAAADARFDHTDALGRQAQHRREDPPHVERHLSRSANHQTIIFVPIGHDDVRALPANDGDQRADGLAFVGVDEPTATARRGAAHARIAPATRAAEVDRFVYPQRIQRRDGHRDEHDHVHHVTEQARQVRLAQVLAQPNPVAQRIRAQRVEERSYEMLEQALSLSEQAEIERLAHDELEQRNPMVAQRPQSVAYAVAERMIVKGYDARTATIKAMEEITGPIIAITLALSMPAAYALARLTGRWGEKVGIGIFITYLVPPTLLFLPLSRPVLARGRAVGGW